MTMISDNERREVARRLRELSKHVFHPDNTYELLTDALGVDDGTDELFSRLAGLIEPVQGGSDNPPKSRNKLFPTYEFNALTGEGRYVENTDGYR